MLAQILTLVHIYNSAGKKLSRITGLDPALPLFKYDDPANRLDRSDAKFVDVLHTSGGWLGFLKPLGHADFFPNEGIAPQPGCGSDSIGT